MRFIVSLGWKEEYEFTNGPDALRFAMDAAKTTTDPDHRIEMRIVPDNKIKNQIIITSGDDIVDIIDDVAVELEEV